MPNIQDYLDWRGDIPATKDNVNEVDNMIFSLLSYVDFEYIAEKMQAPQGITLSEAAEAYFLARQQEESTSDVATVAAEKANSEKKSKKTKDKYTLGLFLPSDILTLFKRASQTPRFQNIVLLGYVNEVCLAHEMQFSAITFRLEDGTLFVAFRGTDDTLVGWKEDMKLSYKDEVPAQTKAVAYLDGIPLHKNTAVYVGGHSKGGNLAVWSAVHAKKSLQKNIRQIYSNDGPGFSDEFLQSEAYLRVADRITFLIPQASIVGLLLENSGKYQIVKSRHIGLLQHNGLSWEVMGASFVRHEKLSGRSVKTDTVVRERIRQMSKDEKRAMVHMFFEVLESTGAKTLTELAETPSRHVFTMFKTYQSFDKEKKIMMSYLVRKLFGIPFIRKNTEESAKDAAGQSPVAAHRTHPFHMEFHIKGRPHHLSYEQNRRK